MSTIGAIQQLPPNVRPLARKKANMKALTTQNIFQQQDTQPPFKPRTSPKYTVQIATVDPQTAQLWRISRAYPGQRRIRQEHVEYLAEEMSRGRFAPTTEIVFVIQDGRYYLVNGQHTLEAIIKSGTTQHVVVLEYMSNSDEETAYIYGIIDTNLGRRATDLTSALRIKEETGFTATQLNAVGAAVKMIHFKFTTYGQSTWRLHQDDLVRYIREYAPYAHQYFDIIAGCSRNITHATMRAPTLGVALVTLRFSAQRLGGNTVIDFWRGAIIDDGIALKDPRKTAHTHLVSARVAKGPSDMSRRAVYVSAPYSARLLATCFNAHVEGRQLSRVRINDEASGPIKIVGSPFVGKE